MVPDLDEFMINTQNIEAEIDKAIQEAFTEVTREMKSKIDVMRMGRAKAGRAASVKKIEAADLETIPDEGEEGD